MIARPIKAKALVFAIFFSGIATGFLLANFYTNRLVGSPATADRAQTAQRAQRDINRFYDYLGLNEEQRVQMHKIGEETRQEFQDLRKETQPRFEAIQEGSRVKIRAVLTDEQREKYDKFRRDMEERRRNRPRDNDKNDKNDKGGRDPNAERPRQ